MGDREICMFEDKISFWIDKFKRNKMRQCWIIQRVLKFELN